MIDEGYRVRPLNAGKSSLAEEIKNELAVDIARCMECGKCSGGCTWAEHFDWTPRKIVQLIKLDERAALLEMSALWTCLSCQLCLDRCPSGIDIPRILDWLRAKAHKAGINKNHQHIQTFYELMLTDIRRRGRINEVFLMAQYNLLTGRYFNNAMLGQKMFLKGKLKLLSSGTKEMRSLRPFFKDVLKKEAQ